MNWLEKEELLGNVISENIGNDNFYEHGLNIGNRYSLEEDINTLEVCDYSLSDWNKDDDTKCGASLTNSFISDVEVGDLSSLLLGLKNLVDEEESYLIGSDETVKNQMKSLSRVIERFSFSGEYLLPYRETNQSRNPNTTYG